MHLKKGMQFGLPPRNSCFVGRERPLRKLQQLLVNRTVVPSESKDATICALHSQNGLGKTEIAVEFFYRNRDFFDCTILLKSSTKLDLLDEFQCLAKYLGVRTSSTETVESIWKSFEQSKLRWLLILDDVDFELDSLPIQGGLGSIIITTKRAQMAELGVRIPVEPLDDKKGAAMMRRYFEWMHHGRLSTLFKDEELQEISRNFANYPPDLLKVVSASFDYESSHRILRDLNGRDQIPSVFRKTSTNADINFTGFPRTSLNLLLVIAYLDGDFISEKLLLSSTDLPMDIGCIDAFRMNETIEPLMENGLVSRKQDGLSIDRDLQVDILCWLDIFTTLRNTAFSSACRLVGKMIPSADTPQEVGSSNSDDVLRSITPHSLRLYENLHRTPGNELASLALSLTLSKSGQSCWDMVSPTGGNILLRAAFSMVKFFQQASGTRCLFDFRDQTRCIGDEAELLERDICGFLGAISSQNSLEKRQLSIMYYRSAVQTRLRYMGKRGTAFTFTRDTDLLLQNAYSDLSFGLLHQGDFRGADRAIETYRGHYEKWDPDRVDLTFEYAKYYLVKSFAKMASGDSTCALKYCQRAIDFLGKGYRNTWLFSHYQFIQATMHFHAARSIKALELHEIILAKRSSLPLPEDDLRYVESIYMVASLSYLIGDYERVQNLCESILEFGIEGLPEECARLQYILSQTYLKRGMADDAKIMADAAEIFRKKRMNLVPAEVLRADDPLAIYDHFCSTYTRLTSKLNSPSVRRGSNTS